MPVPEHRPRPAARDHVRVAGFDILDFLAEDAVDLLRVDAAAVILSDQRGREPDRPNRPNWSKRYPPRQATEMIGGASQRPPCRFASLVQRYERADLLTRQVFAHDFGGVRNTVLTQLARPVSRIFDASDPGPFMGKRLVRPSCARQATPLGSESFQYSA
ncbi:hypothetical protein G3I59_20655 [Amycolatopsis rubida]|uniref:Uncharacterized protein n=1 Tax=Amycolatopsis rubida TaxID=112413 RepID=A0ABX0BUN6_9PSEU|nr:hypothetical protein [Amycolatopsis rubida]MYW92957.1 hypothetical protein [Amycolatopsis rubida]NEC57944.1 hypothetical protein [Amycolatopsis rubida]